MEIICLSNQKGGIGKTSTATTLASILASKGHKTLLIDADPQGNSSDTFRAATKGVKTLYNVLLDNNIPLPILEAVQHTEIGYVVASDPRLEQIDTLLPNDGNEYFLLQEAMQDLGDFEYVIIDTSTTNNKLLKNCLIAADKVIIPFYPDRYTMMGLSGFCKTVASIKRRNNPKLEIAGVLLVKYHKVQQLAKEVKDALEDITAKLGTKVFETTIRECVEIQKAQARQTTLLNHAPTCTTAIDYIAFAEEVLKGTE